MWLIVSASLIISEGGMRRVALIWEAHPHFYSFPVTLSNTHRICLNILYTAVYKQFDMRLLNKIIHPNLCVCVFLIANIRLRFIPLASRCNRFSFLL